MNFTIIPAAFDCLRKGESLANPGIWKVGGMALSAAVGGMALSINSLGKAAGYDLHIDQQTADAFGALAAWVVGSLFHVATTDKLGILPAKPVAGSPGDAVASGDPQPAAPMGSQPTDIKQSDPMRPASGAPNDPNNYMPG